MAQLVCPERFGPEDLNRVAESLSTFANDVTQDPRVKEALYREVHITLRRFEAKRGIPIE